jgi:RHS repeat-associated protein
MKRIPSAALGRHLLVIAGLALASSVSSLSAADTYYVSDHLATTTAVADAAGEIASLEADAFGSPVSGGEQAARYTGKPYDEDIGAYVFPFRNYRSDEARWMSSDPSGFPDGSNGRLYAPNPILGMDPLGLAAKVTASSFTAGSASGYLSFNIPSTGRDNLAQVGDEISLSTGVGAFAMSNTTLGAGFIVQQVTFDFTYRETQNGESIHWTTTYYESWTALMPISGGGYVLQSNGNDRFETQDYSGTYSGTGTITGSAFFIPIYTNGVENFGSNNPDSWPTNQVPQALGQNATYTPPSWLPSGTGATHTLSLTWATE